MSQLREGNAFEIHVFAGRSMKMFENVLFGRIYSAFFALGKNFHEMRASEKFSKISPHTHKRTSEEEEEEAIISASRVCLPVARRAIKII